MECVAWDFCGAFRLAGAGQGVLAGVEIVALCSPFYSLFGLPLPQQ
jgi:hypothetical protein